jgi:hypothetical protein
MNNHTLQTVNQVHNNQIRNKITKNKSSNESKRQYSYSDMSDSEYSDSDFSDNEQPIIQDIHTKLNNSSNALFHQNEIDIASSITNQRPLDSCATSNSSKKRNIQQEKNTWTHQHEPMRFHSSTSVPSNVVPHNPNDFSQVEFQRQLELNEGYSLFDDNNGSYGIVNPEGPDFVHENMQPFVRRGPSANQEQSRADINDRKLNLFSGSINQEDYRPKVERAPLFSTLNGVKNIYGEPVRTDEYKSRYATALSREKRNELPFQQVKVTPGLDIGYNSVGKHGFHDQYNYQQMYKNVDELRTLNNPKISYGSYVGPGKKGDKGQIIGQVFQRKTPKFRERGAKDMVRGRSYINGSQVRDNYDPKNIATVNRGVKENMKIGHAKNDIDKATPSKFRGNYRESRKENFENDYSRNVKHVEKSNGQGHNNQSYVTDMTKRNIHSQYDRTGHVSGNKQSQKTIDYNDTPDVTKRNIHSQYDRTGQVSGNKQSQKTIDYNDTPDITKRNIHSQYDRTGQVSGNKQSQKTIDYNDTPDITKRNIHSQYDRTGQVSGNKQSQRTIDYNDTPDITKRNIHNQYDRTGHVSGNKQSQRTIDYNDTPDITKRNIHSQYDRTGHVSGNKQSQRTIDYNDTPDITKRNIHEKYDRAGHISGNQNRQEQKTIDWDDIPDLTMRSIHNKSRPGGANFAVDKQGSRHNFYNMKINGAKEAINQGRAPTKIGMNKGYTLDHTKYELRDMLNPTWRPTAGSNLSYTNDNLGIVNTKVSSNKFYINDRISSYPADNLKGNPFINNPIHKAINYGDNYDGKHIHRGDC